MKRGIELHGRKLRTLLAKKARRAAKRQAKQQAWALLMDQAATARVIVERVRPEGERSATEAQ